MSGSSDPTIQPKATTPQGIRIENAARSVLKGILKQSVDERREYGGVIHRHDRTGAIGWTGPIRGYASGRVDVGQEKPNCGCPGGTTPVAWYHTHPTAEFYSIVDGELIRMEAGWDKFIEGDKELSDGKGLIGYVATWDGRFWRYDPPPSQMINGKPTVEFGAEGQWGPLNGKL